MSCTTTSTAYPALSTIYFPLCISNLPSSCARVCLLSYVFISNVTYSYSFFPSFVAAPWSRIEVRRRFFEEYAKANSFDPLVPENWYSQSRRTIMSVEVCSLLLSLFSSPFFVYIQLASLLLVLLIYFIA